MTRDRPSGKFRQQRFTLGVAVTLFLRYCGTTVGSRHGYIRSPVPQRFDRVNAQSAARRSILTLRAG